jgi:hypothetical protein
VCCCPGLERGRTLDNEVEFADEGVAEEDEDALLEPDELAGFSGKGTADLPVPSLEAEPAVGVKTGEFGAGRIASVGRLGLIGPLAWVPGLHAQRLVRAERVVLLAEVVQPALVQGRLGQAAASSCQFERAVKAFHLALRLRVPETGEVELDALLDQPHRELRPASGRLRVPPRRAVVHQHRVGHPAAGKGCLQPLLHGFGAGRTEALQLDRVTAGVVEHTGAGRPAGPSPWGS